MNSCRFVGRVSLIVAWLFLASCAAFYPFDYYVIKDGPIEIGPAEWTEIYCPDVIESARPERALWLLLPKQFDVPNYHDRVAVVRETGDRVEIYAEVVDTEGRTYALGNWLSRAVIAGRPRAGIYMRLSSDELPRRLEFNKIRIKSSLPIALSEVLWTDSRDLPPPRNYYPP